MTFSGSSSNWNVFYSGLQSNTTYTVSITATDSFNFTASANTTFQTTWFGVPGAVHLPVGGRRLGFHQWDVH